jgi:hypothetical protein
LHKGRRQHRHGPFRKIKAGPSGPGLQVCSAIRWYQDRRIGNVHPKAAALQAQGIVRIAAALVIYGQGHKVGEIYAGLLRQGEQRYLGRGCRQSQAHGIGIDAGIPVAQLQ